MRRYAFGILGIDQEVGICVYVCRIEMGGQ